MDAAALRMLPVSAGQHGAGARLPGIAAVSVVAVVLITAVVAVFSRRWRRRALRAAGLLTGGLVAVYLVARGIAEFWVVHYRDPASYQHSWGGPSLYGVFAVHSGPGLAVLVAAAVWLPRWRARTRQRHPVPR